MAGELLYLFVLFLVALRSYLADVSLLLPGAAIASFLLAIFLRERVVKQRTDFINQLKSHRRELRAGGTVVVDGLLLRYDSVLRYYEVSIGHLVTSIEIPTPYRLHKGESHPEAIICAVISLFTGWWSITGPQTTLAVILLNLGGGSKKPVSQLIDAGRIEDAEARLKNSDRDQTNSYSSNPL